MNYLNTFPSSTLLLALEPYHTLCNYVAGHMQPADASLQGDGHPVLVIPGLGASGAATSELRTRLQELGYSVYDWKHGMNSGHGNDLDRWLSILGENLKEIYDTHNSPLSLVGWSLGGTYARELATRYPNLLRQVITLATPFDILDMSVQSHVKAQSVRSTSIYSQTDGIVNWESCVGPESISQANIEVEGVSHFGMVHHPEILKVVAGLLKKPVTNY